jgi:EAL and modified HD-GYP domain-containing signal transduction protein
LLCSQLGVDYFQGDLLSPVDTIQGKGSTCNQTVLQALGNSVEGHPEDLAALSRITSRDAVLCYKLLRYINCASFSERTEIHSLEQALGQIGSENLKQWARLTLTAQHRQGDATEQSAHAIIRANMCRDLVLRSGTGSADEAFLVGLLSTLGDALETPLEGLLDSLALAPDIAFALLFAEGPLGHLLEQVKHIEKGEWNELDTSQLARDDYSSSYQAAQQSAEALTG